MAVVTWPHSWADSTPGREPGLAAQFVTVRFLVLWVAAVWGDLAQRDPVRLWSVERWFIFLFYICVHTHRHTHTL